MRRSLHKIRVVGETFCDGLARLVDLAPTELVVLSEESDWGLVGGDLRDALDRIAAETKTEVQTSDEHDDALVEA